MNTPDQWPSGHLPNTDPVSSALDAAAIDARRALIRTDTPEDLARLLAVQQAVTLRYEEEVLAPRRDIWNTTLALVRDDPPKVAGEIQDATGLYRGRLEWRYRSLDTQRNLDVTSRVTANLDLGFPGDNSDRTELRAAVGYLIGAGTSAFPKRKVPDELLGVKAEGMLRWKQIPRVALRNVVVEEALPNIKTIDLAVSTRAIGATATTPLFNIEARRSELEPGGHYLQPQHVLSIYEDLKSGFRGGSVRGSAVRRPTPKHAETFLDNTYLRNGVGPTFTTMQSINRLLEKSKFITLDETAPSK